MQRSVQIAADESISFKMSVSHAHTFSAGLLESFRKGVFKCEAPRQTDIYSLNLHVSPPAELKNPYPSSNNPRFIHFCIP